jgi:5-methylcytosine-specific restriction enzyme subunit McrC
MAAELQLLARAHGLSVPKATSSNAYEALATAFVAEAERALAFGPVHGYRTRDEDSPVLRGRLDLREQRLRRFGRPVPLAVTADEWTADTPENRSLRFAVQQVSALDLPAPLTRRLGRLEHRLADVPAEAGCRLRGGLRLAELAGHSFSRATVFPQLVVRLLTEAASGTGFGVLAWPRYDLDTRGRLAIQPDLVVTAGGQVAAVTALRHSPGFEPYELLAWCVRLGLDTGHLVRASDEPRPETYDVVGAGIRLVVHSVDLSQPLADVERMLHRVFLKLVRLQPISATA